MAKLNSGDFTYASTRSQESTNATRRTAETFSRRLALTINDKLKAPEFKEEAIRPAAKLKEGDFVMSSDCGWGKNE
ncbi:hypothetical protein KH5H1_71850 [Corallococcus caeni]|uniref:hypothetical protein n=1 Tax=Corallococcus caeni TaxID=3082388 RepID=UPI002957904E|nr:hypothetical protein KH5H1_71850 [Corallococcus sp. KH5-1]